MPLTDIAFKKDLPGISVRSALIQIVMMGGNINELCKSGSKFNGGKTRK